MRKTRLLLVIALIASGMTGAHAREDRSLIEGYKHTAWSVESGAPIGIQALAQSADGFIWIGAPSGVYRFDGVTFELLPKPEPLHARADSVTALLATSDGDVWAGYDWGGVALYHGNEPINVNYPRPTGSVDKIVKDPSGTVWVVSNGRQGEVHRFANGRWTTDTANWGMSTIYGPAVTAGEVVVAAQGEMFVLQPGGSRFERTTRSIGIRDVGLTTSQDGHVWTIDQHGLARTPLDFGDFRYADTNGTFSSGGYTTNRSLLFDQRGDLWGDSGEGGVFRLHDPQPKKEGVSIAEGARWFSSSSGLTSNAVDAMIEDREGSLWIATVTGLDRLARANITSEAKVSMGHGFPLVTKSGRDLFIASNNTLSRIDADGDVKMIGSMDQSVGGALCSHRGGGGWFSEANLIHQFSRDGVVKTVEGPFPAWTSIMRCVEDAQGVLWVSVIKSGTYYYDGKTWTNFVPFGELPNGWPWLMTTDVQGRVIMSFGRKAVVRVEAGRPKILLDTDGDRFGLINTITDTNDGLLLGSDFGVVSIRDGQVATLDSRTYPFLSQISGIAETSRGEIWFATSAGLVKVASHDLLASFAQPGLRLPSRVFDYHDGLPGPPIGGGLLNLLAEPDGRVWFLSATGLAWIDPANLSQNIVPPPVTIQSVTVDGINLNVRHAVTLPKGAARLQIDYTALSLVSPDRVKFRYKLEGFDNEWIDPGIRRQAFYTNLPVGIYRFRVIAANDDGVWNKVGATIELDLPPTFFQSKLFMVLCAVTSALALWLVYSLRMRQLSDKIHSHLQERLIERERIARELHDTLLQGVQGLILRLQSIVDEIPPEQPVHGLMEQALDRAEDVLVDGRDRVRDLRVDDGPGDLTSDLAAAAAAAAPHQRVVGGGPEIKVVIDGDVRPLHPIVHEEAVRIGREAILNAARHAKARLITVKVIFRQSGLKIEVMDDGIGMPPDIAAGGRRNGHYGIPGMRERAARIQATLSVTNASGTGSSIALAVPAGVAYRTRSERKRKYLRTVLSARR